nr:putative ribonuclease H-like domain-containing protein [Tanacetum cinerariifolium]
MSMRTGRGTDGALIFLPPATAEEHLAVQRESKARTTLLQSIHDDHIADFYYMDDARDIWNAVKARFRGNVESKKMRKSMLKQEFSEFRISEADRLHKGFLRALPSLWFQVALTLKTKGGLEFLSFDDLFYKLKTREVDIRGYNTFSPSQSVGPSHIAFVSATSTSKMMPYGDSPISSSPTTYYVPSNSKTGSYKSSNVIEDVLHSFVADTGPEQQLAYEDLEQVDKLDLEEMELKWSKEGNDKQRYSSFKNKEIGMEEEDSKALVSVDTLVDWSNHDSECDEVIAAKEFGMIAGCDSPDAIKAGANKLYNMINGANSEEANTPGDAGEFALMGVTSETQLDNHFVQTEKWKTSSKNLYKLIDSSMSIKTKVGLGFTDCIIQNELGWDDSAFSVFTTTSEGVEGRPTFHRFTKTDSIKVVPPPLTEDYTSLSDYSDLNESQMSYGTKSSTSNDPESVTNDFVSCDDSDKSSEVKTSDFASSDSSGKSSEHKPTDSTSCASTSSVSTSVNEVKIESNARTPIKEPISVQDLPSFICNSSDKIEHSFRTTCNKNGSINKKAGHFRKHASYVSKFCFVCGSGTHLIKDCNFYKKQMTNTTVGIGVGTAVRPQPVPTGTPKAKPVPTGTPKAKPVPTSMPKATPVLTGRPRGTPVPTGKPKGTPIPTGKPKFKPVPIGKPKVKSVSTSKPKVTPVPTGTPQVSTPVPTGRPYRPFPVPTDRGYSSSETPFSATEDEGIFNSRCSRSMTGLQTPDDSMVVLKVPRKHHLYTINLNDLCPRGIKREYSNPKTPQQNGVAERKNKTLIEAAKTMLADSKLPTMFWTEAVRTACYVLNRVSVTSPHNKTPYALLTGNIPTVSHFKPFGCHVTILNTIDHLGKFDGKADEGYIVGYSASNKAYRVYNMPNKRELAKLKDQGQRVTSDAEELRTPADVNVVLPDCIPVSTGRVPVPAGGVPIPPGGIPVPIGSLPVATASVTVPAGDTTVLTDDVQAHFSNSTDSMFDGEPTTRFPCLSNLGNHDPSPGIFSSSSYDDEFDTALNNVESSVEEEGIDYDEVFTSVARIEAIRLFLAFASYMGFLVYQMDVKSAFLYERIEEEVYVTQPKGFVDPHHPKKVYKVVKALYGLHQAPRSWYATLSTFLLKHGYRRGTIDKTLFLKKNNCDIILVQVYVDDIVFGSTKKEWCDEFEALMKGEFQMSAMGGLTFFLGLQVQQRSGGIFIHQDKYVQEILHKFDLGNVRTATTPYEAPKPKSKSESNSPVNVHLYRSMIGSLMYLTASRPDIMFTVSACLRHQVTPTTSNLEAVKKIFKYLKSQPKLGLWYPKELPLVLEAYSDSDYVGANRDKKSTTGGCQILGRRLISWQCKKQTIVATSSTEAEYVTVAN